jgi:phosphoadenosine phosphosulfate reductase
MYQTEVVDTEVVDTPTTFWTPSRIERLNAQFRNQSPEALLAWAAETFGTRAALTCSFGGPSGMVLLDMVSRLHKPVSIVFLDTGLLFPETYELAEVAARRYGTTIIHRRPRISVAEQDRQEGPQLFSRDPDRCCGIRKVTPLKEALRPYAAWISGIRRDQSATRATTDLVQWNERYGLLKLSPLAYWTEKQVWSYIHAHDTPYNPLLDQGYRSIGCAPCTQPTNGGGERDGRWVGFAKTECGIHL